jgi:hypothetical protein
MRVLECLQGRTLDFFTRGQEGLYAEKSPKYTKE